MEATEIERLISEAIPGSVVETQRLRADGDHFSVCVTSASFSGKPLIEQHRAVFAALEGRVGSVIQTFSLTTKVRKE